MSTRTTATRRLAVATAAALALGVGVTACGSNGGKSSGSASSVSSAATAATASGDGGTGNAPKAKGAITVFAAASLKETFTDLGKKFEAANPGTKVTFNFGGSSALATSINSGAPADVFAAASPATMKTVTDGGGASGSPKTFVKNTLTIAVPKGNPKHIAGLKDLTGSGVKVALCAKEVPCGAAALTALKAAGLDLTPVTLEQDVKGALTKVELGEVDASLVYRTDVRADAAKIDGVDFPEADKAVNDYPIAALAKAPNKDGAAAFVAYIQSPEAKQVLTAAGFQAP
ncbi:molybdate ABC transporter substrate-binding protein [Kitasatospora aureofaciens]|uniref:Molybdate ABC transporter substrate-binding protein n=1 Tax=Kitasatospora aureofaciens TaxID=1894 RepID=A0A1E7MZS3_KITAU|nr:molybdate ABC transporter substrate-binding protein [Kitasatospora aureofaciens]QEU98974.1 molybdate ABC transporter substrate-binding protein [Streptomyces viridifaciens]ARF77785.1 molybdate ABC transporter substrate-binding protein [Kitasatospora aureofaciens]OEV33934.1 molybdate ABC transporter substrate-binding protein [Kitasatospora aureofaciens]UKZ04993.1 molybdate ABC transporter substrate-binding protein [Streptomyces viridifaciens]GGU73932.1 molybdate-binding protein [Kitasatospora